MASTRASLRPNPAKVSSWTSSSSPGMTRQTKEVDDTEYGVNLLDETTGGGGLILLYF